MLVAHGEPCRGRPAVFVLDTHPNGMRRQCGEDDLDVVAEPDILRSLSNVEPNHGRSLTRIAAVRLQNHVLDAETREALPHRRPIVHSKLRPSISHMRHREIHTRARTACGWAIDPAHVGRLHPKRSGHTCFVHDLHQEQPGAVLNELRARRALLNLHAAFRADVNGRDDVAVQYFLQSSGGAGVLGSGDGFVNGLSIGARKRLAEILQGRFESTHLLRKRLKRYAGR